MRNLLIFILALIVIWWVRRALQRLQRGSSDNRAPRGTRASALEHPELMRACAHCGLHVPESEGTREGEAFFCCDEHRRLGVRH